MAIDMLPTADTSDLPLGLPSTAGNVDSDADVARKLSQSMWIPDLTMARAQVVSSDLTNVGQDGVSVIQNTSGIIPGLALSPGHIPAMPTRVERFRVLAKWVGRVQRVSDDSFVALIEDQLENRPEEEVELPRSEVAPVDEPLLVPGSIFYWSIGYRDRLGGQRTRESIIRFRRLPKPSPSDIADAEEWARGIGSLMDRG